MIYMLLGTGFEETEAIAPLDLLRRAGLPAVTVGISGKVVTGGHGIAVEADLLLDETDPADMEMIIVPGGLGGVASIRASRQAMELICYAWEKGKFVAAICAGPTVLADLGIPDGKMATCYPGCEAQMGRAVITQKAAVIDGKLITGTSAGCAVAFGLKLIEAMKGPEEAKRIADQIVIR